MATHVFRSCSKAAGSLFGSRGRLSVLRVTLRPRLYVSTLESNSDVYNSRQDTAEETTSTPKSQNSRSPENHYHGMSEEAFPAKVTDILLAPVNSEDVEIKPDGLLYLPGIKYRRILNQAFGPGGWALIPKGDSTHFRSETEGAQLVTREYALYCMGRFVAQSVGEHAFYGKGTLGYGKACESAKSNALVRCCKDLGIASELWDPQFINQWKKENAEDVWCVNARTKERKRLWRKKNGGALIAFPWKEVDQDSFSQSAMRSR